MKIGVLSDTHTTHSTDALIRLARGAFHDVPIIIHSGDITTNSVLDIFSNRQVIAVRGDKDKKSVSDLFPEKQILQVNGYRIGIVHGEGRRKGIEPYVLSCFEDVHCIVFGHTHWPVNHIHSGVLLFNPGAFRPGRFFKRKSTVGLLTINEGISGEILQIDG